MQEVRTITHCNIVKAMATRNARAIRNIRFRFFPIDIGCPTPAAFSGFVWKSGKLCSSHVCILLNESMDMLAKMPLDKSPGSCCLIKIM